MCRAHFACPISSCQASRAILSWTDQGEGEVASCNPVLTMTFTIYNDLFLVCTVELQYRNSSNVSVMCQYSECHVQKLICCNKCLLVSWCSLCQSSAYHMIKTWLAIQITLRFDKPTPHPPTYLTIITKRIKFLKGWR